ncbi:hypothetical protein Tco_0100421, partial [Tanacetum coccineum]
MPTVGGGIVAAAVAVVGGGGGRGVVEAVEARGIVDRIDRVARNLFGFGRKSPPEKFSVDGGVVVAGIRRLAGGRKSWERER